MPGGSPVSAGVNTTPCGVSVIVTLPAEAPVPLSVSTDIGTCSSGDAATASADTHAVAAAIHCFFISDPPPSHN
ncbi:hypothetical protein GCM10027320_34720 [Massilia solisilvae]